MICIHGTSVAVGGEGILLRGPSGSGKSDLALRLIDDGARLVADDQVELHRVGGALEMTAPVSLAGLLEVRGLGIVPVSHIARATLSLVVDLVADDHVERMPEPRTTELDGVRVPTMSLCPFAASTPAKLRLAVKALQAPMLAGALTSK